MYRSLARRFIFLFVITLALGSIAESAFAGLIMEQVRYQKGSTERSKGKIYVSNNKIKVAGEGEAVVAVFDLNSGDMIQIDNQGKRYVVAKPEEYFKAIQDITVKMKAEIQKQLSQLPPEQRAKVEEMMKAQGLTPPGENPDPKKLTLKETNKSETIAGYKSQKFEVYENGTLGEEIWVSNDATFRKEFDLQKMANYIRELREISENAGGNSNSWSENEKVFKQIYESGFPMRSIDYSVANATYIEEIVNITKADIPDKEFQPPAGYKKVTLQEMMNLSK
ncbi:MAG TPA: DUF4412 domain-containing protein [Thermodesulfobacteriota bacterium]|nr:DUF4412 domain-containing protein [Thermodesulfobacteriota bacterium]